VACVQIAVGGDHTCLRTGDGALYCYGRNDSGQVGSGAAGAPVLTPEHVLDSVDDVVLGGEHTCAVLHDGTVRCWGRNDSGQCGTGNTTSPILMPTEVSGLGAGVARVSAGTLFSCARKHDGTVWCWGQDRFGEVGTVTSMSCAVWPCVPSAVQLAGLTVGANRVFSGYTHSCIDSADGHLRCWGADDAGELGDGQVNTTGGSPTPLVAGDGTLGGLAASAGGYFTCAVKNANGSLWCWGQNAYGQAGIGSMATPILTPAQVNIPGNVTVVGLGGSHACAATTASVWCWGFNLMGELGIGSHGNSPTPVKVGGLDSNGVASQFVVGLSLRGETSCAITSGGTIFCWGDNTYGQLGLGDKMSRLTPTKLPICF
jgi:alpha-tubulin suppressor-like RCC1 family protein